MQPATVTLAVTQNHTTNSAGDLRSIFLSAVLIETLVPKRSPTTTTATAPDNNVCTSSRATANSNSMAVPAVRNEPPRAPINVNANADA